MKFPDRDIISELQICALNWISDNKLEKEYMNFLYGKTSKVPKMYECRYQAISFALSYMEYSIGFLLKERPEDLKDCFPINGPYGMTTDRIIKSEDKE
jgi:hypothetical protein